MRNIDNIWVHIGNPIFWVMDETGQLFDFPMTPDEKNDFLNLLTLLNTYRKN